MDWKFRSDLPIYSQILEQIKLAIVSGKFLPGERLPSVRDMAMGAGVNPNTMQRALQELEREGLVRAQRTAGRFVTEECALIDMAKKQLAVQYMRDFAESMSRLGYAAGDIPEIFEKYAKEENNGDS